MSPSDRSPGRAHPRCAAGETTDAPGGRAHRGSLGRGRPSRSPADSPGRPDATEVEGRSARRGVSGVDNRLGGGRTARARGLVDEAGRRRRPVGRRPARRACTNDLQRLQAEYANYRKRVDRDRQLIAESATYKALTPVIEVLDTIDRAKEHGELDGRLQGRRRPARARRGEPRPGPLRRARRRVRPDPPRGAEPPRHRRRRSRSTTVKHVAKGGYQMGDRVVRAAQVLVVDPAEPERPRTR